MQHDILAWRILAIGGRAFDDPGLLLAKYFLSLTGKAEPVVYFLPTASGDHAPSIVGWYEVASQLPCRPRHLRVFNTSTRMKNFEGQLLSADAVFVGSGNTLNMLAVWRAQGIDAILRAAWERGIVLGGESAGMICWFEEGVSDSRPERLTAVKGLGFLKGSACPHFGGGRRADWRRMLAAGEVQDGLGCEDGVGVLFEGERLAKVVAVSAAATAYRVRRAGGEVVQERLRAEALDGPPK